MRKAIRMFMTSNRSAVAGHSYQSPLPQIPVGNVGLIRIFAVGLLVVVWRRAFKIMRWVPFQNQTQMCQNQQQMDDSVHPLYPTCLTFSGSTTRLLLYKPFLFSFVHGQKHRAFRRSSPILKFWISGFGRF